ncbi:MAG TPA: DNA polymerase/3'-5' exonuclease PolX [Firmicutes bacterium]|jgi:DNA polymerase (family 10)|nr:DNA polymerase/3'-5' exonuclease PolX [Bacillota bacterium]
MLNRQAADLLLELAALLEIKGENPFKIRAYRRAATALEAVEEDIALLAKTGRLQEIEGIGKAINDKIVEYVNTGTISVFERLKAEIPETLLEVTQVPGVGPKLAQRLYYELGVENISDLRTALAAQRIRTLKGLGEKTEAKIATGLALHAENQGRTPLFIASPLAYEVVAFLRRLPSVTHAEVAGSIRRMRETVGDADVVVATDDFAAVARELTQQTLVKHVLAQGDTKVSVILHSGLQLDVRMVAQGAFVSAWHHFTGSKGHHEKLRHLALMRGYSVSEYGLLHKETGRRIEPASEKDLYALLGLPYIPPELREGTSEITAAVADRLPNLVESADIRGDLHVHSNWSDGVVTLAQIAEEAQRRGFEYVGICDHSRSLAIANGLSEQDLMEREKEIAQVNERGEGAILLSGIEVDILTDGSLDFPDAVLARHDIVIASIHSGFQQSREQLMRRMQRAMANPYVHVIGHPTGRMIGRRAAYDVDVEELIRMAKETGTALEINASPYRLDLNDAYAKAAGEAGVLLAINTDAHDLDEFGHLHYGLGVARRAWLQSENIVNCYTLAELRRFLQRKRPGGRVDG